MRNLGVSFAYSLAAYVSLERGLSRIEANKELMEEELDSHYELLAEPVQTVMRKYKIEGAYEHLKKFTQGLKVTQADFLIFITNLTELPEEE